MYRHCHLPVLVDEWMNVDRWCNGGQEKTEVFVEEKPVPLPRLVSQIQHGLSWH
jgi:hypothetical protein